MSFQHRARERSGKEPGGQGVPRVNRTVQTRVELDAIVSNKTFGNATFGPTCLEAFPKFQRCQIRLIEQNLRKVRAFSRVHLKRLVDAISERDLLSRKCKTGQALVSTATILFCFAAHKNYFWQLPERLPVVCWRYPPRCSFLRRSLPDVACPRSSRGCRRPAGAWSNR